MSAQRAGWSSWLFNLMLLGLGAVVVFLLYAFVARSFFPAETPLREDNPGALVGDIIQVEVRNGCGVTGLAAELRAHLRRTGFDVVAVGDHTSFDQAKTIVVDRVGNPEAARKVAAALGLPEDRVVEEIRADYFLDASVIIGQDYASWEPFKDN